MDRIKHHFLQELMCLIPYRPNSDWTQKESTFYILVLKIGIRYFLVSGTSHGSHSMYRKVTDSLSLWCDQCDVVSIKIVLENDINESCQQHGYHENKTKNLEKYVNTPRKKEIYVKTESDSLKIPNKDGVSKS